MNACLHDDSEGIDCISDEGYTDVRCLQIPDPELRRCINDYRKYVGGEYRYVETFATLDCSGQDGTVIIDGHEVESYKISDLTGIEYFQNLEIVRLPDSQGLDIDLSPFTNIWAIILYGSMINSINFGDISKLTALSLSSTNIAELGFTDWDFSSSPQLESLDLSETEITSLDVSNNLQLKGIFTYGTPYLTGLDLTNNPNLESVSGSCNNYTPETIDLLKSKEGEWLMLLHGNCLYE